MSNSENITQAAATQQQRSQNRNHAQNHNSGADEIDLMALFGALVDRKYFICIITAIFLIAGVAYAIFSTPIYQATAMIQVEENGASMPGLDDMAGMFESSSKSVTEIELLKSRSVIGEAVKNLQLDIIAKPRLFPLIGGRSFRNYHSLKENDYAKPLFNTSQYAWGGERINVFRFDVPQFAIDQTFLIQKGENNTFTLINANQEPILSGKVGEEVSNGGFYSHPKDTICRSRYRIYCFT